MIMNIVDLIRKKRNGEELSSEEIKFFLGSLTSNKMKESQIGAMLMAMFLNGLSDTETAVLTREMVSSGEVLKFDSSWSDLLIDKHSTGGVGDKISLILAPTLAACGYKVPMLSGRGLDFTGGTLDKLESIPGFQVSLTIEQMNICLKEVGCFIAGANSALVPADKILYQHRDVTSTVDNMSLIISSIVSKKVAEGIKCLVMDVKVGRGSWFSTQDDARSFANNLIKVCNLLNLKTSAVLTEMDSPLGLCVGNALEVAESVECLRNKGSWELMDIAETLGAVLLHKSACVESIEDGKAKIKSVVQSGSALTCFENMLVCQGVAKSTAHTLCHGDVWSVLPPASHTTLLSVSSTGILSDINALTIARVCWSLGAGRSAPGEPIDYSVGVKFIKKVGQSVKMGENWIEVHHKEETLEGKLKESLQEAITVTPHSNHRQQSKSRILEII